MRQHSYADKLKKILRVKGVLHKLPLITTQF